MLPDAPGPGDGTAAQVAARSDREDVERVLQHQHQHGAQEHAGHHAGADGPERCFAQDHQGVRGHEDLPVGETRLGGLQTISRAARARQVCRVWRQSHLNH